MKKFAIDKETAKDVKASISDPLALKKWPKFETTVSENPFYHPKAKRIKKLERGTSFPSGSYRFKDEPLRVVYYPEKKARIVYPLDAGTSTDISYKKKSKK